MTLNVEGYLGNAQIKRDGIKHNYSEHEVKEYIKCSQDPVYFIENYIKIIHIDKGIVPFKMYPYQKKMVKHFNDNRFSVVLSCRQSGKCHRWNTTIRIKHKISESEEFIGVKDFHERIASTCSPSMPRIEIQNNTSTRLSDIVERKFVESLNVSDYLIWTDSGWQSIVATNKTIPYTVWKVELENDLFLECADTHILIDENGNEVYAKDSLDIKLKTERGISKVISVNETSLCENMYDLSIDSVDHTYYTNKILSHNTTSAVAYLLHTALFKADQNIALLANKAAMAKEMLARITLALENVPFFLQPGCKALNKMSIEFSNNSRIFAAATSSSSIRGQSCVTGDTIVTVKDITHKEYDIPIEKVNSAITHVLTHAGFKPFDKLLNQGFRPIRKIYFSDCSHIQCTHDHRFLRDNEWVEAKDVQNGDMLYPNKRVTYIRDGGLRQVYDLLNVQDTEAYLTNGVLSHNCSVIALDEFAFVNRATEFFTSTYPVISSGKESKVIITSTPNGIGNMFYKIWEGACQNANEFAPFKINWWDVPGRDEEWKKQTIANTSEAQFRQEYCLAGDTLVTVRNVKTGKIERISLEELHQRSTLRVEYEILTPSGFKTFTGVSKNFRDDVYALTLSSGEKITATSNHMFATDVNQWIEVKDIVIGKTQLGGGERVIQVDPVDATYVYDVLNVDECNCFIVNDNIVSHNSVEFIGSSNTLIAPDALLGLKAKKPIKTLYDNCLRIYEEPIEDHFYILAADTSQGRGLDYSAFTVIDVTSRPFKEVAVYRNNFVSPLIYPTVINAVGSSYNNALLLIESNGPGQIVANALYYDFEYDNIFIESAIKKGGVGIMMTKKVKYLGTSMLKDLIEQNKLDISDPDTIIELSYFEEAGASYQAKIGKNDDSVMCLVLFSWFVSSDIFENFDQADIRKMIYETKMTEIEEELFDFGMLNINDAQFLHEDYQKLKEQQEEWSI